MCYTEASCRGGSLQFTGKGGMRVTSEQKKRFLCVVAITAAALAVLLGYAVFTTLTGLGLSCALHELTGLDCAGCGMSRACLALLRLDIAAAFSYNLLWPVYFGYALWAYLSYTVPYVRRGVMPAFPQPVWLNWVLLGALLTYGIVRNLI